MNVGQPRAPAEGQLSRQEEQRRAENRRGSRRHGNDVGEGEHEYQRADGAVMQRDEQIIDGDARAHGIRGELPQDLRQGRSDFPRNFTLTPRIV